MIDSHYKKFDQLSKKKSRSILMQPSKVRKTPQKQRQRSKIEGAKYF